MSGEGDVVAAIVPATPRCYDDPISIFLPNAEVRGRQMALRFFGLTDKSLFHENNEVA